MKAEKNKSEGPEGRVRVERSDAARSASPERTAPERAR
jgi:hypothetical protein